MSVKTDPEKGKTIANQEQAMKEKSKQMEQQRHGREGNETPQGKLSEHPVRKMG